MIYTLDSNRTIITKSVIIPNNNKEIEEIRRRVHNNESNIPISWLVMEQSLEPQRLQIKEIDLSFDKKQLVLAEDLLSSNLSSENVQTVLKNMSNYNDLYFFVYELYNMINIKPIDIYNIDVLYKIEEMCKEANVKTEASDILRSIPVAENNTAILKLTKKMR